MALVSVYAHLDLAIQSLCPGHAWSDAVALPFKRQGVQIPRYGSLTGAVGPD